MKFQSMMAKVYRSTEAHFRGKPVPLVPVPKIESFPKIFSAGCAPIWHDRLNYNYVPDVPVDFISSFSYHVSANKPTKNIEQQWTKYFKCTSCADTIKHN